MRGGFGLEGGRGRTPVAHGVAAAQCAIAELSDEGGRSAGALQVPREELVGPNDLERSIDHQEPDVAMTHDRGELLTLALEDVHLGVQQTDQALVLVEPAPERLDRLPVVFELRCFHAPWAPGRGQVRLEAAGPPTVER